MCHTSQRRRSGSCLPPRTGNELGIGLFSKVAAATACMSAWGGAVVASAHATVADLTPAVSIDVGSASGSAGSTVSVQVTLNAMGAQVGGVINVITFDPVVPIVGCTVSPPFALISAVVLQPVGCTPSVDCQQAKAIITGPFQGGSLQPIPDGSVLYTCDVKISGGSVAQSLPLTCSDPSASTPDGTELPAQCSSGQVRVVNPTPTVIPCVGDCTGSGEVSLNDILTLVDIALGIAPASTCTAGGARPGEQLTIDVLLTAVNNALSGCGVQTPGPPARALRL